MTTVLNAETHAVNQTISHSSALMRPQHSIANDEPKLLEYAARFLRIEVFEEAFGGFEFLGFLQHSHRIADRRIATGRNFAGDLHFLREGGIGLIDHAGFDVPGFD